jgi:putative Holliday junction resolvase
MRVLGVDFGSKRIGLAVGESEFAIVSPRPHILASGTLARDAEQIRIVASKESAERVVVGIPYNEEDRRMERVCGKLAEELRKLGLAVDTVDESMTSVGAEQVMGELRGSQVRRRKDGEAACRIVERYFSEQDLA